MTEEIGSPERHQPPFVPYTAASEVLRSSEWRGVGARQMAWAHRGWLRIPV